MGTTRIHRILEEVGSIAFPGVFDTLSAKLAHRAGFPMAFVSGYSVAATAIGDTLSWARADKPRSSMAALSRAIASGLSTQNLRTWRAVIRPLT